MAAAPSARAATARELDCHLALDPVELEAHVAVRRRVFCTEQGVFDGDDRDARDERPETLAVIGTVDGRPEGAVRLYPLDEAGLWKGDRLAVLAESRVRHLGVLLVRFAVRTAGERGGRRMIAHVQLPNVGFFAVLGWDAQGAPAPFHGLDHQLMSIDLQRPGR